MYEEQIKELQKNNLIINAELLSKKKISEVESASSNKNKSDNHEQFDKISDNIIKNNNLILEIDNLKNILDKERKAHSNEIEKLDEELTKAKFQFAQCSFEKDCTNVKLTFERKKVKKILEKYKNFQKI